MPPSAYVDGLKMLARRELSEAQVRQRLARRHHTTEAIDAAVARLKQERAIDDGRVAGAIARTEASVKGRGRVRVKQQIENAGIDAATSRRVLDEVFHQIDDHALLETALNRRLRGRDRIADDREFRRLFRYLVSQGFESDQVFAALNRRR